MSPEQLLELADRVEFLADLDEIFSNIEFDPAPVIPLPQQTVPMIDCGCAQYGICMNTICPRAMRITTCLNA